MRWGLVCVVLAACSSRGHVTLHATSASLTPAQRVPAFEFYGMGTEATERIILRDGTQLRYGGDLVPILAADSIAGRAARNAERHERRASIWKKVFWVGFVGGTVLGAAGLNYDRGDVFAAGTGRASRRGSRRGKSGS